MPLGDFAKHTYGSKTWYDELARRIDQYSQQAQKEIFTPSYYVAPMRPHDHACLQTMAHQLRNRYQRCKKMQRTGVSNQRSEKLSK